MMRRMATTLGALAAAATLALAVPNSAYAAEGVLIINGVEHFDPSGCYPLDHPSVVTNYTNEVAVVFAFSPDCTGPDDGPLFPGQTRYTTFGSVFIP